MNSKNQERINATILPSSGMEVLSRAEVRRLCDATAGGLNNLFRRCALAVLTTGSENDDARALIARYPDFDIKVVQQDRGVKLQLQDAPSQAFVDGRMIRGARELLFAVLRDILFVNSQLRFDESALAEDSEAITDLVFSTLRHAGLLKAQLDPNLVVCWGGHSISRLEYDYTKRVGYEAGLRGLDICTGCGPGAMKGPMKGATIAHAKQRRRANRYIGITEPGIIAAESPNPIVNHLVIMPDIEKRLEAFVRLGHGIVVFPGGVGTAEEILYLLGILLHPRNAGLPFPLVFTGPRESARYFEQIDAFLKLALGEDVARHYQIIIDDPTAVAQAMQRGIDRVRVHRIEHKDAFFFNWTLHMPLEFQRPFKPTHEAMAGLHIERSRPKHELAADLRRAFSGIVAGNVKEEGIRAIEAHGPYELRGESEIMQALDALLQDFVAQHRMKIPSEQAYKPCYRVLQ
ncbi:MAG: LOG family protein [Xanthomonadales bacterium]|nr:LOG family protein [Xanthomonadales bacterium]